MEIQSSRPKPGPRGQPVQPKRAADRVSATGKRSSRLTGPRPPGPRLAALANALDLLVDLRVLCVDFGIALHGGTILNGTINAAAATACPITRGTGGRRRSGSARGIAAGTRGLRSAKTVRARRGRNLGRTLHLFHDPAPPARGPYAETVAAPMTPLEEGLTDYVQSYLSQPDPYR